MVINIHEAKTHFSKLIQQALNGEDVVIAKGGKPVIRLIPYTTAPAERLGGQFRGLITMSEDFNDPLPEDILNLFYQE